MTDARSLPKPDAMHVEGTDTGKIHNGDAALALFDNLEDMHESFEPGEERKLVRKIDLMILPFLAVCYALYYVLQYPSSPHTHTIDCKTNMMVQLFRLTRQPFPMLLYSESKKISISLVPSTPGYRVFSILVSWFGRFQQTF